MDVVKIKGKKVSKKNKDSVEEVDGIALNDKKIEVIQSTLTKMVVSTPIPDQNNLDTSREALDNMVQVLDVIVNQVLPDELSQSLRELGENVPVIKSNVRGYIINHYLQQQTGIPAYLSKLTTASGLEEILEEVGEENVEKLKLLTAEALKLSKADVNYGIKRDKQEGILQTESRRRRTEFFRN